MKKRILFLFAVILSVSSFLFTSCTKEDTTAPVITIAGGNSINHSLNAAFTVPTATATDDEDGDLTTQITTTGTVNEDLTGDYTITYSVTDAAGNTATEDLTVTVRNDAYALAGTYDVADTCGTSEFFAYNQIITTSTTVNNRIHFSEFADYDNNNSIYADVSGNTITLTSQTATGIGSLVESHTFSGTGTTNASGFYLSYTDVNNSQGGATASCKAWFTKQ